MIVLETLGRRWFAFAFVAALVWAAWPEGGWRRALRFFAIASVLSFAAEYSSTHNGFPYGRYDYIAGTHGEELYLSNVPLFVPVSFGVVVWAGRALALGTRAARTTIGLAVLGGLYATAIDFVIDPMTLRGDRWFLGDLYAFDASGVWFSVPWSNFVGWFVVSALIIGIDDLIGRAAARAWDGARVSWMPRGARARGQLLAYGICAFFIVLALATQHWGIAIGGSSVTAVIALSARAREPTASEARA